jgi:transcriptional regulator with PAS, ATPase and Fis domain
MPQPSPESSNGLRALADTASEETGPQYDSPIRPAAQTAQDDPFFDAFPPEMLELRNQVKRVIPQEITLLLTGETGTGKTRLANLIHKLSPRRNEPFLVIDCGTVAPGLIESEMFGHVKGAFTGADRDRLGKFAAAGRGTLLLDEINSLPLPLQAKLLRAVDERQFEPVGTERSQPLRARIIAATNASLDQLVAAGQFRADLYYRINVVGFFLPALRERSSCIELLARRFMRDLTATSRPDVCGIVPEAMLALQAYHWPGNIRELRNVIEHAVTLCAGPEVLLSDLPESVRLAASAGAALPPAVGLRPADLRSPPTLLQSKEAAELERIKEALAKHNNNRLRTASELGISRMGLYKKLQKYGLSSPA